MACSFGIAVSTGAVFGFIVSQMPMPKEQFDDAHQFKHVAYGDDTAKFNEEKPEDEGTVLANGERIFH